jgi:putative ABC transport system substrate-binding protein
LGISLVFILPEKGTPSEIELVFAAMEEQRPDAVLVSGEGDLYANRQLIAELAEKKRLPTMCPYRDYVEAGALMGYAVDLAELLRRMADDVHQILKGAKPGDIPIYQHQVRPPDQPEDGKSVRPDATTGAARHRRRDDRIVGAMSPHEV